MAKFLTGNELNSEVEKLFDQAEERIILISPYIKLHNRYASTLKTKMFNPKLEIIVVFGKNEEDMSKSMKKEDFDFFKQFPNLEIRYEKRLHAKYYANEMSAILTSMNLYDYSQNNNIEAGVLSSTSLFGSLAKELLFNVTGEDSFDKQAAEYFLRVIEQSELLFKSKPIFENKLLGLRQDYVHSEVEQDVLSEFFQFNHKIENNSRKKIKANSSIRKSTTEVHMGYCIRTGSPIPFNPKKPLCPEAYNSWKKFGDVNYSEKFCHFSGELSEGETSVSKPILRKNWKLAKDKYRL